MFSPSVALERGPRPLLPLVGVVPDEEQKPFLPSRSLYKSKKRGREEEVISVSFLCQMRSRLRTSIPISVEVPSFTGRTHLEYVVEYDDGVVAAALPRPLVVVALGELAQPLHLRRPQAHHFARQLQGVLLQRRRGLGRAHDPGQEPRVCKLKNVCSRTICEIGECGASDADIEQTGLPHPAASALHSKAVLFAEHNTVLGT